MSEFFLVGGHFTDLDKLSFQSTTIYSTYLSMWLGDANFVEDIITDSEQNLLNHRFTFIAPNIQKEYIPHINSELKNSYVFKSSTETQNLKKVKSTYYDQSMIITPKEEQNYYWFNNIIFRFNKFLTLFIDQPVFFEKIELNQLVIEKEKSKKNKCYLFLHQPNGVIKEKYKRDEMLFNYNDLKDIGKLFSNWLEKAEVLDNVYNLHFTDVYNSNIDLESKLLNAVQTLEVYHRAMGYGKEFDDKEKVEYLETISNALDGLLPDDKVKLIRGKLNHFNEPTLRNRLENISKKLLSNETKTFLFNSNKKVDSFNFKVSSTRNYLTHYDENSNDKRFEGVELFHATNLLKVVGLILLYKEIGIQEDIILSKIKNNGPLYRRVDKAKKGLNIIKLDNNE